VFVILTGGERTEFMGKVTVNPYFHHSQLRSALQLLSIEQGSRPQRTRAERSLAGLSVPREAVDMLWQVTDERPGKRGDVSAVTRMAFFREIDWADLLVQCEQDSGYVDLEEGESLLDPAVEARNRSRWTFAVA